jgi:cytochrome P450 family 6
LDSVVGQDVEVKDILARFTTDIIASCAFGLETNSIRNPDCEFREMGRKIFELSTFESFKQSFNTFAPDIAVLFKVSEDLLIFVLIVILTFISVD